MNFLIIYLQIAQPQNYEDLGIKSILIFIISLLISAVIFLYRSKETALKDKDEKIMQVIKEHQTDLKEANSDYKTILDKYHQFAQQMREIANVRRS